MTQKHTQAWLLRHAADPEAVHTKRYNRAFTRRNKPLVPMGRPFFNQRRLAKKQAQRDAFLGVGRLLTEIS